MEEEDKKCWEYDVQHQEVCQRCIVYINRVHCWEAPPTKARPCMMNYHYCVEKKCPVFEKYRDRIVAAMNGNLDRT